MPQPEDAGASSKEQGGRQRRALVLQASGAQSGACLTTPACQVLSSEAAPSWQPTSRPARSLNVRFSLAPRAARPLLREAGMSKPARTPTPSPQGGGRYIFVLPFPWGLTGTQDRGGEEGLPGSSPLLPTPTLFMGLPLRLWLLTCYKGGLDARNLERWPPPHCEVTDSPTLENHDDETTRLKLLSIGERNGLEKQGTQPFSSSVRSGTSTQHSPGEEGWASQGWAHRGCRGGRQGPQGRGVAIVLRHACLRHSLSPTSDGRVACCVQGSDQTHRMGTLTATPHPGPCSAKLFTVL